MREQQEGGIMDINGPGLDKEYLESGIWKCGKSPSGAHWWIGDESNWFSCQYCEEGRYMRDEVPAVVRYQRKKPWGKSRVKK